MELKSAIFVGLVSQLSFAYADRSDIEIGVGYGAGNFEFKEPEFTSEAEVTDYFIAAGAWHIAHIDRIEFSWRHLDATIGGGTNAEPFTDGLTVEGEQIAIEWQHNFRLSRYFKPWIGAGLAFNQYESTDKFSTDGDGYAIAVYESREELTYSFTMSATLEYEVFEGFWIAPHIGYDVALGDGPTGIRAGLLGKYRFNFR